MKGLLLAADGNDNERFWPGGKQPDPRTQALFEDRALVLSIELGPGRVAEAVKTCLPNTAIEDNRFRQTWHMIKLSTTSVGSLVEGSLPHMPIFTSVRDVLQRRVGLPGRPSHRFAPRPSF